MKKILSWGKGFIVDNDIFGIDIKLTYKGKNSFQSFYGGIVSIVLKLAIILSFILLSVIIFAYGNTKVSTKTVVKDLLDDTTKHYVNRGTFGIAVAYVDIPTGSALPNYLQDQTYFSVNFGSREAIRQNNTYTDRILNINSGSWGDSFPLDNSELYQRK